MSGQDKIDVDPQIIDLQLNEVENNDNIGEKSPVDIDEVTPLATGEGTPLAIGEEKTDNAVIPTKEELTKITELLGATVTSLTNITENLSSDVPDIKQAVIELNATAEKLKDDNPFKGGKSRRKAYKNKKKNKTKKGGRKSKKNQKNKR